ncbi:hypothetical protein [Mariniflexile sp. AS56]|uniref:hypothetical protein n=1 Tax=Mariniflexile sp. AS56 TaxID=3063957 RepID=UPI0026EF0835|nr:hypothetical protein [Mariniflexile sp. AS56]MDO7174153.1 hypothetical protein [Mariniflexile sp. AS56]
MQVTKYKENNWDSIVASWKKGFIDRTKTVSKSRKQNFTYEDALSKSTNSRNDLDAVMIEYISFINSDPLKNNDYFKYLDSYAKGKELNLKYFKHDVEKLQEYYKEIDKGEYLSFNMLDYKKYVLFMVLKLNGFYEKRYDLLFNVKKKDGREYNPLTSIPKVLRGELPFNVKEYDIKRAFPTFIDIELKENRGFDVYEYVDKRKFNALLNSHAEINGCSIESIRKQLYPIYKDRVSEVITEDRFFNKGKMFKDLVKYEGEAITAFVSKNNVKNYARLHDGVFVLSDVQCSNLFFNEVEFAIKKCVGPEIINNKLQFYYFDKGELVTTAQLYSDFFVQENFMRVTEEGQDKITIFKDTNNVIAPFNHKTDILPFLKENINEFSIDDVVNRIAKDLNSSINGGYHLMEPKVLIYYTDKKSEFGISFKNGFARYNKEEKIVDIIDYKDVNGFFPQHNTQSHEFIFEEKPDEGEFEVFLKMICIGKDPRCEDLTNEEKGAFLSFCCMIGYMCQTYKNPSFCPAIILSDADADDESRKGGRGKSLLTKAISHVQNSILKGGVEFDSGYRHNFDDLHKSHRVYIIDDVLCNFNYDGIYTNVSGDISCGRKTISSVNIPFKYTPKFIITTNWAVRYDSESESTNRRFYEYKFTNYFNKNFTPRDVFKHNLFDDWDKEEWNKFYNFIFYCVGSFLEHGMERIKYDKNYDNFMAYFNNDLILSEFERVFDIVSLKEQGFTTTTFVEEYLHFNNPLKNEKYFHQNNVKKLLQIYIKHKNLPFKYGEGRRWRRIF